MFLKILETLGPWSPLIFGLAFVAPVFAAFMKTFGMGTLFGLPAIVIGLIIGAISGFIASKRESWI